MNFTPPANLNWFLPFLKKISFFKEIKTEELFKYPTEELLQKYNHSKEKLINLLLAERFLYENIEGNLFSQKLLELALEEQPVSGYLISFSERKNNLWDSDFKLSFIKLNSEDLYFYPLEWGSLSKLFINFWKQTIPFRAVETDILDKKELQEVKEKLKLAELLDFSYLSKKVLEELKKYLPSLKEKELEEINKTFLNLKKGGLLLINGSNLNGLRERLRGNAKKDLKVLDSDKTILICGKISELNEIITDLKNTKGPFKAGVLTEELWNQFKVEEATPLVFLIGALEHAKRLKDEHIIFFNGFTYHVIGDLYYEWNNLDKALKYYLLAQKHTQQPVELALSIAAVYYALGELEKAEKVLKKELCACRGEDPAIHYNLGLIYIKKEKLEEAKFHLYKAYLLQPENQIFREALVKCLWDMGAYEELEEILNSIKNPSEKEEIFLGKLYFQKKDYQRAFEYLKKIFKLPDRDGETLLFLAWLYLYFNKEKEVIDILLKEAQNILSEEEFNKIIEKLGLELR